MAGKRAEEMGSDGEDVQQQRVHSARVGGSVVPCGGMAEQSRGKLVATMARRTPSHRPGGSVWERHRRRVGIGREARRPGCATSAPRMRLARRD